MKTMMSETEPLWDEAGVQDQGLLAGTRPWPNSSLASKILPWLLCVTLVSNGFLLYRDFRTTHWQTQTSSLPSSAYYGSEPTTFTPFYHDWMGLRAVEKNGYRYADDRWIDLFPKHGGAVALASDFRHEHGLSETAVASTEDPDKKIYMIAGYHQLHCLSVVRDSLYYLNGTMDWPDKNGFVWDHVLHCVEAVRLGLTCFLDPTLINLEEAWPGVPNGQEHQCRNRNGLHAFAEQYGHAIPGGHHH